MIQVIISSSFAISRGQYFRTGVAAIGAFFSSLTGSFSSILTTGRSSFERFDFFFR
jgi:hypothetical protein